MSEEIIIDMHGVLLPKLQIRLIWEMQRAGYLLGAAPEDGFLYFLKLLDGPFGICHMIPVFMKENDGKLSLSFHIGVGQAISGMQRGDIDESVRPIAGQQARERIAIEDYIIQVLEKACNEGSLKTSANHVIDCIFGVRRETPVWPGFGTESRNDINIDNDLIEMGTVTIRGKEMKDFQLNNAMYSQIILAEGIAKIGWQGIARCDRITELEIPSSVREIGYLFCMNCKKLSYVKFLGPCPEGMERAFEGCEKLEEISVPEKYSDEYRIILLNNTKSDNTGHNYKITTW